MLKELRYSHSLTIKELSESIAIDARRIKLIERGLDSPTEKEIKAITDFFSIEEGKIKNNSASIDENIIGEGYVTAVNKDYNVHFPRDSRSENKIRVLDLFSGIGGLSYGFEQTEQFTTVGGLDLLKDRVNTFQLNHTHAFGFSFDINSIEPSLLSSFLGANPDVIVGGAPCQGFSSIRPFRSISENDLRNNLYKSFALYLDYFKPTWFVFENVVGLLTHKNGDSLKTLIHEFNVIGYKVDFRVLNAAYYGAPQLRERLILVGNRLNIDFEWPVPTHYYEYKSMAGKDNSYVLKPQSKMECIPATTITEAISDLPPLESGQKKTKYINNNELTEYQEYLRKNSTTLKNHDCTSHSPEMLNIIRHSGYNIDAVRHLVTSGFSTCYSRLEANKPSVTLTVNFVNPSSNKCIHPYQNRALTPREGARIQGFPDRFRFSGTRTQIVKQIGNAVPPVLSKVIAASIFRHY